MRKPYTPQYLTRPPPTRSESTLAHLAASTYKVPPSGLGGAATTSSGRRPTRGPGGASGRRPLTLTRDACGLPTATGPHTRGSLPRVRVPRRAGARRAPVPALRLQLSAPHVGHDEVVRWARETAAVCSDEWVLHPEPFPDRDCGALLGVRTWPTGSCPHRSIPSRSSSTTIRSRRGTQCCRASHAPPRGAGPKGPATGTAGSVCAPSSMAVSTFGGHWLDGVPS